MATQLALPKPKVLKTIQPNVGIQAEYQRQLDALVTELSNSVTYWLSAQWRSNTPELAQDASPAAGLRAAMRKLSNRWMAKFNAGADKLSKLFADKTLAYTDARWTKQLRDIGFTVRPTMTASMQDVYSAVVGEQVGLIRSLGAQYLGQVETLVMQSVQTGRDLGTLHDELRARYGITKRRAALIARDQNNKATATFTRTRQRDAGVKQARWRHSHAGKEPRPSHVAADGEIYDVDKGMYLDGVWTWPGVEINCRCTSDPIIPGLEDEEDD